MIDKYFTDHSIDQDFVKKTFLWSWNEDTITIPIFDENGTGLFNRYRHLTGTAKFSTDKGSHPALYCLHKVKKADTIVLCEGEPDCVRLWQEGIPAITGTSGVKTFSTKLASPLAGKTIFIVLDNDEAGTEAIEKYYQVLETIGAKPYIKELPQEFKDVSEYFTGGNTKADFEKLPKMSLEDWKDSHEPEEYSFEEGPDLLKRDLPPEEWLVDRILPSEGFAFIIGPEATGKSFYTLTLADSVTTGKSWLDQFKVNKKVKVLIIDKENTKRRVQSRMKGLSMEGANIFWLKYPHFFELTDPNEEDGFSKMAKSAARKVKKNNIQLIIVDAFTDIMIGNENAAGDVQKFFDAFRQLFPGTSILVLHHASKPAQGVPRTSAQRARGSTNIMAQVYSAFYVEALPKSKSEFTIEQTKAGDAEKLNKFLVELQVEPIPNSDGKTKVTSIAYKGEVLDQEMKVAEATATIEEAFRSTSQIARQELIEICTSSGISQPTAERAIRQLKEAGTIDSTTDPTNKSKRLYVWRGEQSEIFGEED